MLLLSSLMLAVLCSLALGGLVGYALRTPDEPSRRLISEKKQAYYERNAAIAFMVEVLRREGLVSNVPDPTKFYVGVNRTAGFVNWETCLYIDPPKSMGVGQLSWHYHITHVPLLPKGLPRYTTPWDGRDKNVKYRAMQRWVAHK